MRISIALILTLALAACVNHPPAKKTPPKKARMFGCKGTNSPDGKLRACVIEVGKFPAPLNESRIDIRDTTGKLVASRSFGSTKGDSGRSVVKSAWTPDSQFFVFSTQSSGGHSPWHWNTYFFSRKHHNFSMLDDTIGPVINPNFKLKAPDVVTATVQGTAADPSDIVTGHPVTKHLGTL